MTDCNCISCQSACSTKPGWFMPNEAEKLADFFGITFEEVFKTKLAVDWYESDNEFASDVFVLSPNVVDSNPGEEFDANPNGICVFFVDGTCSIHEVKPFECVTWMHTDSYEKVAIRHRQVAHAWSNEKSQGQITDLLGREPETEVYEPYSFFGGF